MAVTFAPSRTSERVLTNMRVLLVEDELRLARLVHRALTEEGYAVDLADTGQQALTAIDQITYDVIVLDVMLPDSDGLSVCRQARSRSITAPILLLTARDTIQDRVTGLDAGADDYLTKPFALAELAARLRALTRRPRESLAVVLRAGELEIDPASREVRMAGEPVILANKEFRILEYLMRNPNRVLTRTMIADHVWDYDFLNVTNVIDVHIRSLRRKIGDPYPGTIIQTVRGIGYKLFVPR